MVEHTRESLIEKARELALRQDSPLTRHDFMELTGISRYSIEQQFPDGGFRELSDLAGNPPHPSAHGRFSNEDLLVAFHSLVKNKGRIPSLRQFNVYSKFSSSAIIRRFHGIHGILRPYIEWLTKNEPGSPYIELAAAKLKRLEARQKASKSLGETYVPKKTEMAQKENLFRKEGNFWVLSFGGTTVRAIKHLVGMDYIRYLLENPGRKVSAAEFIRTAPISEEAVLLGKMSGDQLEDLGLSKSNSVKPSYGEKRSTKIMDEDRRNKDRFRERIRELEDIIDEPESTPREVLKAREERERLLRELKASYNKGADTRRTNVSNAINRAIKNIKNYHPSLAEHLKKYIDLGNFCVYIPPNSPGWNK